MTRISTLDTRKSSGLKLFCFVFKFSNIFKFESLLKFYEVKGKYNLYYKVRYVFVCGHYNVPTLTSPSVFKLLDSQGYLWLPYDLAEVIKLFGETSERKNIFFSKKYFISFLLHYCHSFHSTVIPSGLLSFLPDYCHSFRISVIPSKYCHFFQIIQRITNTN